MKIRESYMTHGQHPAIYGPTKDHATGMGYRSRPERIEFGTPEYRRDLVGWITYAAFTDDGGSKVYGWLARRNQRPPGDRHRDRQPRPIPRPIPGPRPKDKVTVGDLMVLLRQRGDYDLIARLIIGDIAPGIVVPGPPTGRFRRRPQHPNPRHQPRGQFFTV